MKPRLLVVDDHPVNLELTVALLEEAGFEVLTAETPDVGLYLAATQRPSLILMDIQLPGLTGYEATRMLKADPATASIPVVALTAQALRGEDAQARASGCDGYLTKPVDREALLETIRRLRSRGE